MVKCDIFELKLAVEVESGKRLLTWSLYTDLPAGTLVILTCTRKFLDMRNDKCLWTGHNEKFEVQPSAHGDFNGASGRIDVDRSDKKALDTFNRINTAISSGIKSSVSDELTVGFMVGARQRLRAFGKNNAELSGQMVCAVGGINVVDDRRGILISMQSDFQPVEIST